MGKDKKESSTSVDIDVEIDPCTGFSATHKAKLSVPTIIWNERGQSVSSNDTIENPEDTASSHRIGSPNQRRPRNKFLRYVGIFLTFVSAVLFSINVLVIKILSQRGENAIHPFNLGIWTYLFTAFFSMLGIVYVVKVQKNQTVFDCFKPRNEESSRSGRGPLSYWLFICGRSFFGTTALIFFFYAAKYIHVADALVIDSASPIFVYIMAFIFLGEKLGFLPIFSTILALAGVAFICRPPLITGNDSHYDMNTLIGVLFSFLATLCITVNIIFLKFLENLHFTLISASFGIWGTLQCLIISLATGVFSIPTERNDIFLILATCSLFLAGCILLTVALQYEDAGPVGLVRTTEVFFIFIWQYIFLGVIPDIYSYIGAALVLLGVVLTIARKWLSTLPESNRIRNSLCRILLY